MKAKVFVFDLYVSWEASEEDCGHEVEAENLKEAQQIIRDRFADEHDTEVEIDFGDTYTVIDPAGNEKDIDRELQNTKDYLKRLKKEQKQTERAISRVTKMIKRLKE